MFRRENDSWLLAYEERVSWVRHRKELALIAQLLQKPNEPIHVRELASMSTVGQADSEEELQAFTAGTGPLLDSAATHSYRERARELRDELEEARQLMI